jgi:hypothetical protein
MQTAQQAIDKLKMNPQFQKQMAQPAAMLDSAKKTNSSLSNVNIPDFKDFKLPDFDSLSASMGKAARVAQSINKAMEQSLPKQDASHHAGQLSRVKRNDVIALANALLQGIQPRINNMMRGALDKMANDPSINAAATGAFILASGGSSDAAAYLICKGI